jgi:hypothetical protein
MEEKFFVAKVQYDLPDENSGKIKKIREEKLFNESQDPKKLFDEILKKIEKIL